MVSIIITAWKEEKTIGKAIEAILDPANTLPEKLEILIVAPDEGTINAAEETFKKFNLPQGKETENRYYKIVKDPGKGKPIALNHSFKIAKGEILILTDGDVYLGQDAISSLVSHFEDQKVGGVSGRPVSADSMNNLMGYYGNLLADAAHHKRMVELTEYPSGKTAKFIKKGQFFPMSGYVMAIRNLNISLPEDVLVDDAYLSYILYNKEYKIEYEPEAKAYVKYATHLDDYFKQKKRSVGGFIQLWKYDVVKKQTKSRSFWHELEYVWFPIKYAQSFKQFIWSLLLYPVRLWLWVQIWFERKFNEKSFEKTWVRIESTK